MPKIKKEFDKLQQKAQHYKPQSNISYSFSLVKTLISTEKNLIRNIRKKNTNYNSLIIIIIMITIICTLFLKNKLSNLKTDIFVKKYILLSLLLAMHQIPIHIL